MAKITIYRFEVYDVSIDDITKSRRWGTREAVESIARGRVLPETATEVDGCVVDSDIQGFTVRDFQPNRTRASGIMQ